MHSLVKLEYMLAWVSNSDRGRAIAKACLSATRVCYGRCIALRFAQHSCDSNAARDALVQRICKSCLPLVLLFVGLRLHRGYLSDDHHRAVSIASSVFCRAL